MSRSASTEARALFEDALRAPRVGASAELTLAGTDYIVTHGALDEPGWRSFAFTPRRPLLASLTAVGESVTQAAVPVLLLVLLAGGVRTLRLLKRTSELAHTLAAPLQRLSRVTASIGTDQAPYGLTRVGIDEIDTLTDNLDRMAPEVATRAMRCSRRPTPAASGRGPRSFCRTCSLRPSSSG